jgi:hypothetical protein
MFHIGSEDENGAHIRGQDGWPYSIYLKNDAIGGCDAVLCHGIQNLNDAEQLLELCNSPLPQPKSHMQMFAWIKQSR